jgi:anti-sigma factor RsiW
MFDFDSQLKLQAYLDGELPSTDAQRVEQSLAQEPEARALIEELKATRSALAGFETGVPLPESRDFYWSKIQREIQRQSRAETAARTLPWAARLRQILLPAGGLAVLLVAALAALIPLGSPTAWQGPVLEATVSDPAAFTYRDYASGTTLVWLSFPEENETSGSDDVDYLF